jgi:hypothetical protein
LKLGRNDEEDYVPDEGVNKEMEVRECDKPLDIDTASGEDDKEEADGGPYTGSLLSNITRACTCL